MRKLMCFLTIKVCKPILVVTQNKIMNLKISMSPLNKIVNAGILLVFNCCYNVASLLLL